MAHGMLNLLHGNREVNVTLFSLSNGIARLNVTTGVLTNASSGVMNFQTGVTSHALAPHTLPCWAIRFVPQNDHGL